MSIKTNNKFQAIIFMLAAMFSMSCMNVVLRSMAGEVHSTQIVVIRHFFCILLVILWTGFLQRGFPKFPTKRLKGHFWRAICGVVAMEMWFYSVTIMPINIVTALSFTMPIFSAIFAILFLGEKAGIRRWSAIGVGFIGMIIIIRPDSSEISYASWIVIASSFLMAASGTMVKSLTSSESPENIAFYMAFFMLFASIPFAIPYWDAISTRDIWRILLLSIFATAAHLCMARAFVRTEMVVLMPLDFTRLIFTAVLAALFFGEALDYNTAIGAFIIASSTIYIANREAINRKKKAQNLLEGEEIIA